MEEDLKQSFQQIVSDFGQNVINDKNLVNIVADYFSFDRYPAVRNILKAIVNNAYTTKISQLKASKGDPNIDLERYAGEIEQSWGYRKEQVIYVLSCIASSVGIACKMNNSTNHNYQPILLPPSTPIVNTPNNQNQNNQEEISSENQPKDSGSGKPSKRYRYSIYSIVIILFIIFYYFNKPKEDDYPRSSNTTAQIDNEDNSPMVIEPQPIESSKEEIIIARVEYMFKEVYENGTDGNSKFLTTEFKDLINKEQEITPEGEIGWIDYDHWIQAQDYENPSMTVRSVEILSDTKAKVMIRIKAFADSDDYAVVELVLIHERGDWYIDDFIGVGGSEKKELKDYIASIDNQ